MPTHEEAKERGEHQPQHAEVHPCSGTTAVLVVEDVDETGWVLLENEQADLLEGPAHGSDAFGEGLGKKEEKRKKGATSDENEFHASHLLHSARTSPTKVATMAPIPIKKPMR